MNPPGMNTSLSDDEIRCIIGFMDGDTLLRFSVCCTRFWDMTTRRIIWRDAAMSMFPHLRETRDASAYGGDWRMLVADYNRRNRSMVFTSRFARISTDMSRRRKGSLIIMNDFSFHVIIDPQGNPNIQFGQPVLSAYLACMPTESAERDWECCCQFSLTLVNQKKGGRNKTWHSTLPEHRFSANGVFTWGLHEFIPHTEMNRQGFVVNDTIDIRVRMCMLYMRVRVIRADGTHLSMDIFRSTRLNKFRRMIGCASSSLWAVCGASELPVLLDDDDASVYSLTCNMMVDGLDEVTIKEGGGAAVAPEQLPIQLSERNQRFLRFDHVVALVWRSGGDPRRIAEVFLYRLNEDPVEAFRYVMAGRNIDYCCDQCGTPDFIGLRYHCHVCDNYDLCEACAHSTRILPHRYSAGLIQGRFYRIRDFHEHTREHRLMVCEPLFYSK